MSEQPSVEKDAWRKRLGAALVARGDVYAVVGDLLTEARNEALIEAADAVQDECRQSSGPCFCGSADWLRTRVTPPAERPYCLRCEVPIYRDDQGVWRREATGSQVCPRNPAVDGHEPAPTSVLPPTDPTPPTGPRA